MGFIFAMYMLGGVISVEWQLRKFQLKYEKDKAEHDAAFRKYLFNSMFWPIALAIYIITQIVRRMKCL